jgi:hypothetical protein
MSLEPNVLPGRHGADMFRARQVAAPLRRFIKGVSEPSPVQWQAIGESLMQGDSPMDALLDWMSEAGLAQTMPLYNRALKLGIAAIGDDAPEPLLRFFSQIEATPEWLDLRLLVEGARVCCLSGLTGMRVLRDLGLLAGYQASAINRTLVLTGALEKGAQRRIAETSKWWIDCTRPGGMARGAAGYCSTLHVRLVHALVRRRVSRMAEWDASYFGLPINQGDMHATYLAFSVIFLVGQRLLGVPLTKDEREAVLHLWRYIAWLMGVDERWLHAEENAATCALYHNLLSQAPADASSRQLGAALIDEPLQRHYPNLALLRGRLNRAIHLSIARTFIDAEGRRALGLPEGIVPWYPLLTAPPRYLLQRLVRCLPGGRQWLVERGARQQQAYMMTLFGDGHPNLVSAMQMAEPEPSRAQPRI